MVMQQWVERWRRASESARLWAGRARRGWARMRRWAVVLVAFCQVLPGHLRQRARSYGLALGCAITVVCALYIGLASLQSHALQVQRQSYQATVTAGQTLHAEIMATLTAVADPAMPDLATATAQALARATPTVVVYSSSN